MEVLFTKILNLKFPYLFFLLIFLLIKQPTKAQEIEDSIPEFKPSHSIIQNFGLHSVPVEDNLFPYELLFHTRLLAYRNEKLAYGINSVLIHTFGSEIEPRWFYHIGYFSQYYFLRKRRLDNNRIYFAAYLEGGLNLGNYYFTIGDNDKYIPLKKLALQANFGIGAKQYLGKFLFIDYGLGFMSIIFKRIPEAHNAFGFYRIGLGRDLIFLNKKNSGRNRNSRNL